MARRRKADPFVRRGTLSADEIVADVLEVLPEILDGPPGRLEIATERFVDEQTGRPVLAVEIRTSATRTVLYEFPRTSDGGWIVGGLHESFQTVTRLLKGAAGLRTPLEEQSQINTADSREEPPR